MGSEMCIRDSFLCIQMDSSSVTNSATGIYQLGTPERYHLIRQIYNAYDNVLLLLEQKPKHMEYRIMPEGDFLTGFHVGHWNAIGEAYERMKAAVRIVHEKLD